MPGILPKRQGLNRFKVGLEALGIKGIYAAASHHELDAVTCAYVGNLFLEGKAISYRPANDAIIMPTGEKPRVQA